MIPGKKQGSDPTFHSCYQFPVNLINGPTERSANVPVSRHPQRRSFAAICTADFTPILLNVQIETQKVRGTFMEFFNTCWISLKTLQYFQLFLRNDYHFAEHAYKKTVAWFTIHDLKKLCTKETEICYISFINNTKMLGGTDGQQISPFYAKHFRSWH